MEPPSRSGLSLPSRQSTIALKDITAANWEQVIKLAVNREQVGLVATNLHALCRHQFFADTSIVKAIVADGVVAVGFMQLDTYEDEYTCSCKGTGRTSASGSKSHIEHPEQEQELSARPMRSTGKSVAVLRLVMVDQSCQSMGFGTRAFVDHLLPWLSSQGFAELWILCDSFPTDKICRSDESPRLFFEEAVGGCQEREVTMVDSRQSATVDDRESQTRQAKQPTYLHLQALVWAL